MTRDEIDTLIDAHIGAEDSGDTAAAVAMYTDDIEHDVVGAPGGPLHGPAAARARYDELLTNIRQDKLVATHTYYGDNFCVIEHDSTCRVIGSLAGIPGNGRQVTFRMLHIFKFRDGRISRENVWMDLPTVMAQLAD